MALSGAGGRLPFALEREIEDLRRFRVRHTAVADQVILAAEVRGVPVVLQLDQDTYPSEPPRLEIAGEWSRSGRGRLIRGLESQEHWNRTLGIGALLRELEQRFLDDPPKRRSKRGGPVAAAQAVAEWLRDLGRRLFGRRAAAGAGEAARAMPAALRARYQELIREKSSRVERYKQAVARLMTQWQRKTAGLEELGREIQALERDEEARMAEAERLVTRLKASGKTLEQIRQDARYRRCLAAYEDLGADLAEKQERLDELEHDAEEHLAKIREHEARLEALVRELEELRDESEEVAADLATIHLEQEIADLRAGISRAGSDRELQDLLRQFRKAKAAVRVTREAADLDDEAQDAEYLEAARKVEAARRFESKIGLGESAETSGRDRAGEGPALE